LRSATALPVSLLVLLACASTALGAAPARPKIKVWQEPIPPRAADPFAPDRAEAGTAEAIAALTSSLRFLPPPVAYLPAAPGVPSPAAILGHVAGAPEIGRAADVHRYFRRLAAASDRVRVLAIGSSEEGREIMLALVSAGHNLAELAYVREAAARLADPRRTPPGEAERLADGGKLVYYVVGGTQPGELASPEMLAELAYRLAVSERPEVRAIREEAIVLITPVAEPDAYDRAVEWYRRHLRQRAGVPWAQLSEILAPPYAGHYGGARWAAAGDSGMGLASTRAIAEGFFGFHPQVLQGLGTSPPLLSLGGAAPAGAPAGPAEGDTATAAGNTLAAGADPWPALAAAVGAALRGFGMPGVRDDATAADRQAADSPNSAARRFEPAVKLAVDHNAAAGVIGVFGNGTAGEFEREVGELEPAPGPGAGEAAAGGEPAPPPAPTPRVPGSQRGKGARQPAVARVRAVAAGWPLGGRTRWSLRDGVNYAESATLAALAWAAGHRRELLAGCWQRGTRAWERARGEPPYAWIFPARQSDPGRLASMVRRLLGQRLQVQRLREELTLGERRFAAGSYVVRLDQPYREAALRFLGGRSAAGEEQEGIPWPFLYGVEGSEIGDRAVLDAAMEPVSAAAPPAGRIAGAVPAAGAAGGAAAGPAGTVASPAAGEAAAGEEVFLLRDTGQLSLLAARIALGPYQVDAAEAAFTAGGAVYPAGSWLVQAPRFQVQAVAERLGLTFAATPALPEVPRHVIHLPRLGVLHGWTDAESSGWLRAALDRERLPYTLVSDEEVRRGGLGERFDLLLLAGADRDWQRRVRGIAARWSPLAFTRTAEFPSHGTPDGAADVTGGLDEPGFQELRRFVAAGGVLVTLGNASALAAGAGLAAGLAIDSAPAAPTVPAAPEPPEDASGAGAAGDAAAPGPAAPAGAGDTGSTDSTVPVGAGAGDAGSTDSTVPVGAGDAASPASTVPAGAGDTGSTDSTVPAGAVAAAGAAGADSAVEPSAELRASVVRRDHPAAYGYPDLTQVLRRGGPLLTVTATVAAAGRVVLRFGAGRLAGPAAAPTIEVEDIDAAKPAAAAARPPLPDADADAPLPRPLGAADGRLVLAGRLAEPAAALDGRPAIVDLPLGKGHLVVFAFDPFDPTLGPADLRFVYNVLLNWHALPR
jgi:hypothetical protein